MGTRHVPGKRLCPEIPRPVHSKRREEIAFHVPIVVDAVMAHERFDPEKWSITSRELRAIVSRKRYLASEDLPNPCGGHGGLGYFAVCRQYQNPIRRHHGRGRTRYRDNERVRS